MENDREPVLPVKPIGPTEARERAEAAARAEKWDESTAWSMLGLLALKQREGKPRGR